MPRGGSRGKKWHGKGWRDKDTGEFYINLKHSWDLAQYQREMAVMPRFSISELMDELHAEIQQEGECSLKRGMHVQCFFRKKALKPSPERATRVFDGGEVIYVKVFDEEDQELFNNNGRWAVKYRGYQRDCRGYR